MVALKFLFFLEFCCKESREYRTKFIGRFYINSKVFMTNLDVVSKHVLGLIELATYLAFIVCVPF